MLKGLYTAWTGMVNEQYRMDTLSNNLANADTVGFKKEGTTQQSFDSILVNRIKDEMDGVDCKEIGSMSLGVKIGENYTDYSNGSFRLTDSAYDFAIAGDGFFAIEVLDANGDASVKYTRDGSFMVDKTGYLRNDDGDYVLGSNGNRIQLNPNTEAVVERDGRIYQNGQQVGQLGITDFEDYNYLEKFGNNYYEAVEGAETKASEADVYQGYLEMSNVQIVSEMVNMISISRAYESNQKLITTMDNTLQTAVTQVGKV